MNLPDPLPPTRYALLVILHPALSLSRARERLKERDWAGVFVFMAFFALAVAALASLSYSARYVRRLNALYGNALASLSIGIYIFMGSRYVSFIRESGAERRNEDES